MDDHEMHMHKKQSGPCTHVLIDGCRARGGSNATAERVRGVRQIGVGLDVGIIELLLPAVRIMLACNAWGKQVSDIVRTLPSWCCTTAGTGAWTCLPACKAGHPPAVPGRSKGQQLQVHDDFLGGAVWQTKRRGCNRFAYLFGKPEQSSSKFGFGRATEKHSRLAG